MKGICFIEPLFYAAVNGKKTQTRRIMKRQTKNSFKLVELNCIEDGKDMIYYGFRTKEQYDNQSEWSRTHLEYTFMGKEYNRKHFNYPYYKLGEKVYLKEPYSFGLEDETVYKYNSLEIKGYKWENKLFMPAKYARYFIEITAVRCERLQDIGYDDCLKEGIKYRGITFDGMGLWNNGDGKDYPNPQRAYEALIDKINGKGTWESNPYVWVYDFKLLKK
jgi:hypothetical protein